MWEKEYLPHTEPIQQGVIHGAGHSETVGAEECEVIKLPTGERVDRKPTRYETWNKKHISYTMKSISLDRDIYLYV